MPTLIAPDPPRLRSRIDSSVAIKMWLFPGLSYSTVGTIGVVLAAMALTADLASQFHSSLAITRLCLVLFFLFRHGRVAAATGVAP